MNDKRIIYCDTDNLKKNIENTNPYKGGLYPHEAYLLSCIYMRKPIVGNEFNYGYYPFDIESRDNFLKKLIEEDFVTLINDETQLNYLPMEDLRSILKNNNIKCVPSRKGLIELINSNFSTEEINHCFTKGYYDLTKKGLKALQDASDEIYDKLIKIKDNDLQNRIKAHSQKYGYSSKFDIVVNTLSYNFYSLDYNDINVIKEKNNVKKNNNILVAIITLCIIGLISIIAISGMLFWLIIPLIIILTIYVGLTSPSNRKDKPDNLSKLGDAMIKKAIIDDLFNNK